MVVNDALDLMSTPNAKLQAYQHCKEGCVFYFFASTLPDVKTTNALQNCPTFNARDIVKGKLHRDSLPLQAVMCFSFFSSSKPIDSTDVY
mmetsp:Transcript_31293/g.46694  ORF Transcript_31293/g.46694 Transcript_31293/m.46694 type:complete len:90 (+) Transcript_31293:1385-1654(+)